MARLTTMQAARRLGVKPSTIYAYVSRGVLTSLPSPDGRQSMFSSADIEQLALRGRPRQASRSHALDFTIDTAITSITQHQLLYRGHDAVSLSAHATFEQVADLLLTGSLDAHQTFDHGAVGVKVPAGCDVFDRVGLVAALAALSDPSREDLSVDSVARIARRLISTSVVAWPSLSEARSPRLTIDSMAYSGTIAGRLWNRMSPKRPKPGMVELLNAALVLLADHELAVSTVAARVTASTRSDPYAVVGAGISAIRGPLHGAVSRPARRMLEEVVAQSSGPGRTSVPHAARDVLDRHDIYPGFGHKVYKSGDPRADAMLLQLRALESDSREMEVVEAVIDEVHRRIGLRPNIDTALAAFGVVARLPEDSGQRIFCVARIAGWCAHAIEEYAEAPLRFRARAVYIG